MPARVDSANERTAIGAVTRVDASLPVDSLLSPRREAQDRLDRIAIGQVLQGSVVARLDDGSFMVELAGLRLRMQLPAETRVGQKINLSLQSRNPQPGFQIEPDSPNTVASFSAGARLIESVLQAQRDPDRPPVVIGKNPVLPAPSTHAPLLAQALRQTLEQSGLFYEAHVAAWAQGSRALPTLEQEPQQRDRNGVLNSAMNPVTNSGNNPANNSTNNPPLSPELAQLVSAQLDTLEHQRLAWQGQVWPGQNLVIETRRQGKPDDARGNAAYQDDPPQAVWQTTLHIDLPRLGRISANLHLIGNRVRIDIESEQAQTAQHLQRRREPLANHLQAAGLGLIALSVDVA